MIAVLGAGSSLDASLATRTNLTASGAAETSLTAIKYAGMDGGNMQYRYFTDGTDSFREGVRDGGFVLDKTLTDTGFNGIKGPGDGTGDWENLEEST